ncbi:MAG: amino acid permease, partial [Hyphomonadaceae bacterium]|nr:amino acid permease [Hyphomonadaceae bacterium]
MAQFYTPRTATAIIIANMIGTGVFTSLGFQLIDIQNGFPILLLWVLGGVAAFCGAVSYGELGAALPRSGGEYNFLGRIYHPMAGFISGWVSATVGFAAPTAAVAIAFATYALAGIPGMGEAGVKPLAVILVIAVTLIHVRNRRDSGRFQFSFTVLKIVLILIFCTLALIFVPEPQTVHVLPQAGDVSTVTGMAFGVSLIFVTYAYTGWNAATYVSGELENPQRDLPRVLVPGTAVVTFLYVLLNYVFMKVAPVEAMAGEVEIAAIAAKHAFGESGGRLTAIMLAVLLVSSASAMTLAGPRALQMVGEDFRALRFLSAVSTDGVPRVAILVQSLIAVIFIITSSFQFVVVFTGAILAFNSFLAVAG